MHRYREQLRQWWFRWRRPFPSPELVRQYFLEHADEEFPANDAERCPLAKATGYCVSLVRYTTPDYAASWVLPPWARIFVSRVDTVPRLSWTGAQCAQLLTYVLEDLAEGR